MNYLEEELLLHPLMQPSDAAKFCFQAVFGAEHLLSDPKVAEARFFAEFEAVSPAKRPLAQNLSDRYCRVDIAAWKAMSLPPETLFSLFLKTAQIPSGGTLADFEAMLSQVRRLSFPFSEKIWDEFLAQYPRTAVHHSEIYRNAYFPSYRVVRRDFLTNDLLFAVDNP